MDEEFDAARFIVRVRRRADLSQRQLADVIGVSRATIGRLESGASHVDTATLGVILSVAGLRLAVLDEAGKEVTPVPIDLLRDHANRRFPGHLDVLPPEDMPAYRGANPRRGRPDANAWFLQRRARATLRDKVGVPLDHPSVTGERRRKRARREAGVAAAVLKYRSQPLPECTCLDECFELACLEDCSCQCERRPPVAGGRRAVSGR